MEECKYSIKKNKTENLINNGLVSSSSDNEPNNELENESDNESDNKSESYDRILITTNAY